MGKKKKQVVAVAVLAMAVVMAVAVAAANCGTQSGRFETSNHTLSHELQSG